MKTKLYFCCECGVLLADVTSDPEEGDKCSNCGCDTYNVQPIEGQFEASDAKYLRSI
jgi:hypothetical protein